MELNVRAHGRPLTPSLVVHAQRRVQGALHRLAPEVRRVEVRLADVNGPRGGVDQRCKLSLTLAHHGPELVAEATDERMEVAIDLAATRIARRLRRYRDRQR